MRYPIRPQLVSALALLLAIQTATPVWAWCMAEPEQGLWGRLLMRPSPEEPK